MFLKGPAIQPMLWTETVETTIDFCLWVLLADGLRVPPFDAHPGGSGQLQAAGLTAAGWRAWLERVVIAQAGLSQEVRDIGDLTTMTADDKSILVRQFERSRPPNAWNGHDAVADRLRSLWVEYQPEGEAWRRQTRDEGGTADLTSRDRGRLWREVDLARTSGRTLTTYLVRYPAAVVDALPPDTLIVAPGPEPDVQGYVRLLRRGIARLEVDARADG
jgi:hypothetical protein